MRMLLGPDALATTMSELATVPLRSGFTSSDVGGLIKPDGDGANGERVSGFARGQRCGAHKG